MSLLPHLGPVGEYLKHLRQLVPLKISLSTTQKMVLVSVGASILVVGGLARYLRRKKRVIDPAKLRRNNFSGKRSRASGVRSPNDTVSIASSGRRSAGYSNIYGDRYARQSSTIASTSEKTSVVSGSLASGSITLTAVEGGGGDGVLTPQQLGVVDVIISSNLGISNLYKQTSKYNIAVILLLRSVATESRRRLNVCRHLLKLVDIRKKCNVVDVDVRCDETVNNLNT
ncbi:unnamed protein product [Ceutorhynchus assimilis]|uniref:Uncharacterized protein n=1 Tax=Ceutorhynchus assimilis TaxID=467358 RepID=A0A9N9MX41_9CUCU|nr:unnamed protein product [Ceutorhynchus assimilis]